ncbi:MAG TPA: tRNA glutamyl-Q(34) synthetase GluQRS [Burkholderiaceae bacterium]|nr:tRNA glutamyl-Q(34) synthetase GluQRS [Burkholderiaceae bacterium]
MSRYRGRFAPSPTGPLHAGSLAAALASWLDARAAGGHWIVRIEDLDPPRTAPGAAQHILETLARCGLESDEPVVFQSQHSELYETAFVRLQAAELIYGCACSRKDVEDAIYAQGGWRTGVYPGTCAAVVTNDKQIRAYRVRVPEIEISFLDRAMGGYAHHLQRDVGDFVVRRADGLWAYQLAVVVDDAAQGITDIVRGADLLDNTPRQIFLQRALGLATPTYLHVPLVLNAAGEKLSKQSGAVPLEVGRPIQELRRAAQHLGLGTLEAGSVDGFLSQAVELWTDSKCPAR